MSNKKQQVKQSFKQAVKQSYEEKSLSDAQLEALQKTLAQKVAHKPSRADVRADVNKLSVYKWLGSIAASLLFAVSIMSFFQTPALITSAYADIYKDANLHNGMQSSMQQWLDVNRIDRVPQPYPVQMSKFCRLGPVLTTHLRIAGKAQGEMNVFFHQGEDAPLWLNRSGKVDDMHWKLLKVRENLTVIVLYSHDMREKSVQFILHEMLPELRSEVGPKVGLEVGPEVGPEVGV